MSNLFKSKFLLGLAIALALVVSTATTASAAITSTLKMGMSNSQVMELQQNLNGAGFTVSTSGAGSVGYETSYFGSKTKAAVMAYQTSKGLVADGVFGPLSRAAWTGGAVSGNFPAGCNSAAGYSPTTGLPCNSSNANTFPAGCTSASGFSATTGLACSGTTTSQTGPLTAMLATNNPASGTLVAGQATADLAHFTFTGSGTVTGVTLQRLGVSADSTPSNVYLFDGATRLTDAASVASNGKVTFSVPAGIFTVNGSKTISVKSDIASGTSGQTVGMMLATFTTSAGTVTANLSGNIHTIASATLATITGLASASIIPNGATLNPGPNVTVWQDTFSINTRDVWMKRLALRNVGSAPTASFQNFKLFVNGVQVGTAASLDVNGYVTFDLMASPVLLVSGSRVIRVDADIVSGASRTVHFSLRQAADVDLVDSSFGVNITPGLTGQALPWTPTTASTISGTSGGTLTIEKDVTSPSTNVVNNGSDVNIGTFKFTAYGEAIKVETLRIAYTGSANIAADDDSLRNARVLIGGVQYGSSASLNETTDTVLAYTSYTLNYTFMPGVPVLVEIHSDIYDDGGTNDISAGTDTIQAVIAVGSSNATRQDSLGSFNAPATAVSANTLTVASTAITLARNNTYAAQTTTLPATTYKIGAWNLAGSSVEDVLLTTLSFDIDEAGATTEFDEGDITNMYVVVKNSSGAIVAQPSPIATLSTGGQDNNFSINYTLPKNQSLTLELFANLADDGQDDTTSTASGSANDIDADDGFLTDLTVTGNSLIGGASITATSADTAGQTISFGTAYIQASVDASSPDLAIVQDNQTVTSGAFKFSAVTAGFNVTDVQFLIPATGVTSIQNVMLYDGATLVATLPGAATVAFSGLTWNVPANSSKVLTVKLQLGSVGLGAGTTQGVLTTTLDVFTTVNTSTGVSDASAADSGQSRESTANPAASAQYVHSAIPVFTQGSVSATLTNAIENDLYKLVVSPTGGAIALKQLKFLAVITDNVGTNNTLTLGSLKLYRGSTDITADVSIHTQAGITLESTNTIPEGSTAADNTIIVTWVSEEQISSATEYTLKGTPAGFTTGTDDDSINININTDSALHTIANSYLIDLDTTADSGDTEITIGLAPSTGVAADDATHGTDTTIITNGPNIIWSDVSALPHTETVTAAGTTATSSADWTNGYLVLNLPLSGMTKNN